MVEPFRIKRTSSLFKLYYTQFDYTSLEDCNRLFAGLAWQWELATAVATLSGACLGGWQQCSVSHPSLSAWPRRFHAKYTEIGGGLRASIIAGSKKPE